MARQPSLRPIFRPKYNNNAHWCNIGGKHFHVHSNLEEDIAWILSDLQQFDGALKDWWRDTGAYVFDGVTSGSPQYTPDFEAETVTGELWVVEGKGLLSAKDATKMRRFLEQYEGFTFFLITRSGFRTTAERRRAEKLANMGAKVFKLRDWKLWLLAELQGEQT